MPHAVRLAYLTANPFIALQCERELIKQNKTTYSATYLQQVQGQHRRPPFEVYQHQRLLRGDPLGDNGCCYCGCHWGQRDQKREEHGLQVLSLVAVY